MNNFFLPLLYLTISSLCLLTKQEVKESFDFWGTPEGDLVHPADCMTQLLEQVRRHRVNIDGNVCTAMVTTLVLEVVLPISLQLILDCK